MSYYADITSPYIWTLLWRGPALSDYVFYVSHNNFGGKYLLHHQQWNYRNGYLIATSAIPLSIQVWYNLPVLLRRTCVQFQLFKRGYVIEFGEEFVVQLQHSQFCVLKNEEADNDWLFVFNLCLASSTSYKELFTWSSFLNSSVELCRQMLAKFGNVQPSFNILISLSW